MKKFGQYVFTAAGDKEAQANLGSMYEHGIGVARNPGQAVYWYSKAAEQGHADARSNLARFE